MNANINGSKDILNMIIVTIYENNGYDIHLKCIFEYGITTIDYIVNLLKRFNITTVNCGTEILQYHIIDAIREKM